MPRASPRRSTDSVTTALVGDIRLLAVVNLLTIQDIDWEYPGGNGADYIQHPNSEKVSEIHTYAQLLGHIKAAIGEKELSIAVPALEKDMIAFTAEQVPKINAVVDFVNVMTYDMMSRRDNVTNHHTSVNRSLHSIETYAARGMSPSKMNLGFPFYAKFFTTAEGAECTEPIGCPTALLEAPDGSDTGKSGVLTFEAINFAPAPTNLTESSDMTCGAGTFYRCPNSLCCSQYNSWSVFHQSKLYPSLVASLTAMQWKRACILRNRLSTRLRSL